MNCNLKLSISLMMWVAIWRDLEHCLAAWRIVRGYYPSLHVYPGVVTPAVISLTKNTIWIYQYWWFLQGKTLCTRTGNKIWLQFSDLTSVFIFYITLSIYIRLPRKFDMRYRKRKHYKVLYSDLTDRRPQASKEQKLYEPKLWDTHSNKYCNNSYHTYNASISTIETCLIEFYDPTMHIELWIIEIERLEAKI